MKFLPLILFALLACNGANAQIFIETGGSNADKYQDNGMDSGKVETAPKTPQVKIIPQSAAPVITPVATPAIVRAAKQAKAVDTVAPKMQAPKRIPIQQPASVQKAATNDTAMHTMQTIKRTTVSQPASAQKTPTYDTATRRTLIPKKIPISQPASVQKVRIDSLKNVKVPSASPPSIKQAAIRQPAAKAKVKNAPDAQTMAADTSTVPPNAEVGKCYARTFVADEYEYRADTIMEKPSSYNTRIVRATYRTVRDSTILKKATVRYKNIPAVYDTVTEDVIVTPATQKWVKGAADPGCLSPNPADCQTMKLEEVTAVTKKETRQVIKTPASKVEVPVPAQYKITTRLVMDQPSRQEKVNVPAAYKIMVQPHLISKGGYSEWKEIICANKLDADKVSAIQHALKNKGYLGAVDSVLDVPTKAALIRYQQDNNLPAGNLNMETLKALGVQ